MSRSKPLVLITGSSGLIGSALAARLCDSYSVIGLDHIAPERLDCLQEFVPIDLTSEQSINDAFDHVGNRWGRSVASLIHLAAFYDFSGEPSPLYETVTVQGTERLLFASGRLAIEQFVFSSTTLVHAPTKPGQPINEDSPVGPKWAYPESKVKTENIVRASCEWPYVILRIAGVYTDDGQSLPIANQIQRIYERKLISRVFPGEIAHGQPFVHIDDAVDALARTVNARAQLDHAETFLIGEPDVMSYDALQRAISKTLHGEELETQAIPKAVAKAGAWIQDHAPGEEPFIKPWMIDLADDHLEVDVSRARHRLGWIPRHSLARDLSLMLARLEEDPARWYRINDLSPPAWLEQPNDTDKPEVPVRPEAVVDH